MGTGQKTSFREPELPNRNFRIGKTALARCGVACFYPEQCAVRRPGLLEPRESRKMASFSKEINERAMSERARKVGNYLFAPAEFLMTAAET